MANSASHLSDEEFDTSSELLEAYAAFDMKGVLGLLHAVAIAPVLVLPSTWLPRILSEEGAPGVLRRPQHGAPLLDAATLDDLTKLLMRLYNEVLYCLRNDGVLVPGAADVNGCKSFAEGFVAGAALVPEWTASEEHWSFVVPFAYLADRLDLVSPEQVADIERDLEPDPKQAIRDEMDDLVHAASDAFDEYRRASGPPAAARAPQQRVGRNDPCPCGSGKKYKRCCATRAAAPT